MRTRRALTKWIDEKSTRSEFARRIDCSESHLSLILQGKRGVSYDTARNIEKATGGDIAAISLMAEKPLAREATA